VNILVFIPFLTQANGGVKQYSIGLLNVLSADKQNTYFIYHCNEDKELLYFKNRFPNFLFINDLSIKKSFSYQLSQFVKRTFNFLLRRFRIKKSFEILNTIDRICILFKIDIVHCPYQYAADTSKAKMIITMHDVQELHFPEYFSPEERAYRAVNYYNFLKKADAVVVSYNHVKSDLVKYFNIPEKKIYTVLLKMDNLWFDKFSEKDTLTISELKVPEKFLLYPANTWKHKNHRRLLEAVDLLRKEYHLKVTIICTGHLNEYYTLELAKVWQDLKLEENVRFLGIVNERELYSLYKSALGVVVPTLYEAGSFPLMESILLNVPVICSDVTSLPETVQNPAFLFDPYEIKEIANKIKELWELESFRQQSIANSKKISDRLKNTQALDQFMNLYQNLMVEDSISSV
jgi:glycosyltransferase involved in cell wall biosynthesis